MCGILADESRQRRRRPKPANIVYASGSHLIILAVSQENIPVAAAVDDSWTLPDPYVRWLCKHHHAPRDL